MIAYCVLVYDTKEQTATVSQEAYKNYEDAERFIKSRSDVSEIPDAGYDNRRTGIFIGKDKKYIIKEIRII